MSEFFRALERADEDRARRQRATTDVAEPELRPSPETDEPPPIALARAPRIPREAVEDHLVSLLAPSSMGADHYRILRDVVEQRRASGACAVLAVTSPGPGDGKSTTAINLAGALAQDASARVLLVDADLRNPSIADLMALENPEGLGLTDAIVDPALSLSRVVCRVPRFNLSVLDSGRASPMPYEILRLPRLGDLIAEARRSFDHVVVDAPPALPFPDCRVIGRWVDGFFLVVAAHKTPRRLFEQAVAGLDPGRVAGVVFNGDDSPVDTTYYDRSARNGHHAGWLRRRAASW
jgi:capsular exopolysaccharide synthesis family protein